MGKEGRKGDGSSSSSSSQESWGRDGEEEGGKRSLEREGRVMPGWARALVRSRWVKVSLGGKN